MNKLTYKALSVNGKIIIREFSKMKEYECMKGLDKVLLEMHGEKLKEGVDVVKDIDFKLDEQYKLTMGDWDAPMVAVPVKK